MPGSPSSSHGGSGGLIKLLSTTRGTTGALDTGAGAIAAGHGQLRIVAIVRTAVAATTEAFLVRFNGDSGANYDQAFQQGNGSPGQSGGGSAAQTSISAGGLLTGNTATASYASTLILDIPFYDNGSWFKTGTLTINTGQGVAGDVRNAIISFGWRSLTAISQVVIDSASHPLTGSSMVVYGTE
jgi:hypothetical protein